MSAIAPWPNLTGRHGRRVDENGQVRTVFAGERHAVSSRIRMSVVRVGCLV